MSIISIIHSIENRREKTAYFKDKIEPNLSLKESHQIRESYCNIRQEDISKMEPSELYARGLLVKTSVGWEIK